MVIPPLSPAVDVPEALWTDALNYCQSRRAILIIDPPSSWNRPDQAISGIAGLAGLRDPNSVMYFPRIRAADPLRENMLTTFVPSGVMAGLMARTDGERGVWKAPAGLEAGLAGVRSLAYALVDGETG
jgi:phage tail sheath protein FI